MGLGPVLEGLGLPLVLEGLGLVLDDGLLVLLGLVLGVGWWLLLGVAVGVALRLGLGVLLSGLGAELALPDGEAEPLRLALAFGDTVRRLALGDAV